MFRFRKKYKNEISKDQQERETREFNKAVTGISSKFNLDESLVGQAYKDEPKKLSSLFRKSANISFYQTVSLGVGFLSLLGMGALKRPIIHLMLVGAAAGVSYVINRERMQRLKQNVNKQLEDHTMPNNNFRSSPNNFKPDSYK